MLNSVALVTETKFKECYYKKIKKMRFSNKKMSLIGYSEILLKLRIRNKLNSQKLLL